MTVRLRTAILEEYLLRSNVSRCAFARTATLSSGYLAQLLSGKRRPSGQVREKLMQASGIGFDELFQIVQEEKTLEAASHAVTA